MHGRTHAAVYRNDLRGTVAATWARREAGDRGGHPALRLERDPPGRSPSSSSCSRAAAPAAGSGKLNLVEFFTSRMAADLADAAPVRHPGDAGGTVAVTGLAMLLAVPLGLGAAVYVSEFAGGRLRETLKVVIELLAAVPSIVWGFVGYMVARPADHPLHRGPVGINLLCGGIILALMSVPIIVSVGEDALKAVPDSFREAGLALGASRWEIVHRCSFRPRRMGCWPRCSWGSAGRSARRWPC